MEGARERQEAELSMLEAMYPEQAKWMSSRQEVVYTSEELHASLTLRLPNDYLVSALPEVITATSQRRDLRDEMQAQVRQCEVGTEILDVLIEAFIESISAAHSAGSAQQQETSPVKAEDKSTVIVWLHHLLNTNKRKQALSPSIAGVSGITKPGYPGVLVYAGPSDAVMEHVRELKSLNWQAFQVRLEVDEEWVFQHGSGIIEAESMAALVADLPPERKQEYLQAIHIT